MSFLRKHWFDVGGVFSILVILFIVINHANLSDYQLVIWLSLLSLFLHQLEEYRVVGTFPGMLNKIMFKSDIPDRYPLNTNTALFINVFLGWSSYFLAAIFAEKCIWLGLVTILVSVGNIIVHTIVFNIKGKTLYNAGMLSSLLFFAPISYCFFRIILTDNLVQIKDYYIGIPLGVAFNGIGIFKLIDWMKNKNTGFIFPNRCLLPEDRS